MAAFLRPHYQLGRGLNGLGELDDAQFHFEQTLRFRPDDARALNDLGVVLARKGAPDRSRRAQACFRRELEIDREFADAHYKLGVSELAGGEPGKAATRIETALRLDPNHPMAGQMLNRVRGVLNKPE